MCNIFFVQQLDEEEANVSSGYICVSGRVVLTSNCIFTGGVVCGIPLTKLKYPGANLNIRAGGWSLTFASCDQKMEPGC